MAKETFSHRESWRVLDLLDEAARRSGVSRGQAFEDFLHMSLCALSGGRMEDQYLQVVQKHSAGPPGKRGCDSIATAFGTLIDIMERTRADILGDVFQGAITYGEEGQFLTPEPVCELMARLTLEPADAAATDRKSVFDPCCGSGRLLLAAASVRPECEFVGQDIDLRCVRMTAINLALHNRYGHVIWGSSLTDERRLVYRTGFDLRGFVRELTAEESSATMQRTSEAVHDPRTSMEETVARDPASQPTGQLYLF